MRHRTGRIFTALAACSISHPKKALAFALLLALLAAPGIARLKLRTDGHALVSPTAPEVVYDKSIRAKFGIEDQIVVLIHADGPDGIFNPGTLQLVRDLTAEFTRISGVNSNTLTSLATEPSFRMRPGSLMHQTLLEPPLKTKAEIDLLRDDLRRIELYTGTVVSASGKSTVILIGVSPDADRTAFYRRVSEILAAKGPFKEEVGITGAPVAESLLGIHILEDLGVPRALLGASTQAPSSKSASPACLHQMRLILARRIGLVTLAALVMMAILLLCFRNVLAMLITLPGVAATMLFVFGLMGLFSVPIYLTIAVMPVLLIATGVTNDIYLFTRYFALLREKPGVSHVELLRETFDKLASPVAATSVTAAIGFFSFAFSPLAPVQAFGVFTGIGVLFGLFYSLTAVPAILVLLKPDWLKSRAFGDRRASPNATAFPSLARGFSWLGLASGRARWWILGVSVVVMAVTPFGLRKLAIQDSWTDAFDPDSDLRRVTRLVNDEFHGMHLLLVSFDVPQLLRGEVGKQAITPDGVVIGGTVVTNPILIAGSAISITAGLKDPPGAASNNVPTVKSHIEMVYGFGNNVGARIPRRDIPPEVWDKFTQADGARVEVVIRNHVRP